MLSDSKVTKTFISGLLFVLPILITIALLAWAVRMTESILSLPLKFLLPDVLHFPGMGILVGIVLVYLIGLAIHGRILKFLFNWIEALFTRLPLLKTVYQNIKDLIDFMSGGKDKELERVVMVSFDNDLKLMGFVTQQVADVPSADGTPLCAVYLPMSYQVGGYTLYLPESRLETVNISTREAMQRILTADISVSKANVS